MAVKMRKNSGFLCGAPACKDHQRSPTDTTVYLMKPKKLNHAR